MRKKLKNSPFDIKYFPNDNIDFKEELIPAVREWLNRGIHKDFLKSCVRIGNFEKFSGGLKAKLVGGLRIDVSAVLKLGGTELKNHKILMDFINQKRPHTFPLVVQLQQLSRDRFLLLMEQCRGYVTLLEKVYNEGTTNAQLQKILDKVFKALTTIHNIMPGISPKLSKLSLNYRPFGLRIQEKMQEILAADNELKAILEKRGTLNGMRCASFNELVGRARNIENNISKNIILRLVHGDSHLSNIMVRKSGSHGFRVRFIDPNPDIGFSQPLYDIGKLLHWAEPVGWAKAGKDRRKSFCKALWISGVKRKEWELETRYFPTSASSENRRVFIEKAISSFSERYRPEYGLFFEAMRSISIASAHLGFAAVLSDAGYTNERRFIVASALQHLSKLPEIRV